SSVEASRDVRLSTSMQDQIALKNAIVQRSGGAQGRLVSMVWTQKVETRGGREHLLVRSRLERLQVMNADNLLPTLRDNGHGDPRALEAVLPDEVPDILLDAPRPHLGGHAEDRLKEKKNLGLFPSGLSRNHPLHLGRRGYHNNGQ